MRRPDGQRPGKPKLIFAVGCSRPPSSMPMCISSRPARSWRASVSTMRGAGTTPCSGSQPMPDIIRMRRSSSATAGTNEPGRSRCPRPEPSSTERLAASRSTWRGSTSTPPWSRSTLLDRLPGVSEAIGYRADGLLTREAHHLCRGSLDRLFTDHQRRSAARTALRAAAAQGVATVHELGGPHLGPIEDLTRVREVASELGMGVATYWGELATEPTIEWAQRAGVAGLAGDLCVDGAIGSRTASLREPYADAETCGARYLSEQQIADHVIACTRAGLQAGFHCIGDDAVAAAVSGLRRAAATLGVRRIRAARHRLEHVEMISDADIATLAELGVVASMQPAFDAAWGKPGELYEQRLGASRARGHEPFGHSGALRRTARVRHGRPSDPTRRLGHRAGRGAALATAASG